MSDKKDKMIDDFFAEFDEMEKRHSEKAKKKTKETDTYSAEAADEEFSFGSASSFRSETYKKKSRDKAG